MINQFSPKTIGGLATLKNLNRSHVLNTIRRAPGISRAGIAQKAGLTKATVGGVVQSLIENDWIIEGELRHQPEGRPIRPLHLNSTSYFMLGAEVDVEELRVAACNLLGEIIASHRIAHKPADPGKTAQCLTRMLESLRDEPILKSRVCLGLGLAVPGTISSQTGLLRVAPNLRWSEVNFLSLLYSKLSLSNDVWLIENEANAAAFGEFYFYKGVATPSLTYISLGTGIGCGLVSGTEFPSVNSGNQGLFGEIGHTVLQPDGALCRCGNAGCVETLVSGWALREQMGVASDESLVEAVAKRNNDESVASNLITAGKALGMLMLNLHHTINTSTLVIGGPLVELGDLFINTALEYFENNQFNLLQDSGSAVPVIVNKNNALTAARGAAAQVMAKAVLDSD